MHLSCDCSWWTTGLGAAPKLRRSTPPTVSLPFGLLKPCPSLRTCPPTRTHAMLTHRIRRHSCATSPARRATRAWAQPAGACAKPTVAGRCPGSQQQLQGPATASNLCFIYLFWAHWCSGQGGPGPSPPVEGGLRAWRHWRAATVWHIILCVVFGPTGYFGEASVLPLWRAVIVVVVVHTCEFIHFVHHRTRGTHRP